MNGKYISKKKHSKGKPHIYTVYGVKYVKYTSRTLDNMLAEDYCKISNGWAE